MLVQFSNGNQIVHNYDLMGNRLRTTYYTRKVALVEPATNTIPGTDNLLEYNIVSYAMIGNKRYVRYNHGSWALEYVYNPEGYIKYWGEEEHYPYYYIKDHLGSVRETYINPYPNGKFSEQRMQYYPSGLPWNTNLSPSYQPFKYGGKEFVEMHGLDEYDSEARWYYPAIMRTTTMDPMCEKYYSTSPYVWCGNNPVNYVDPDGEIWTDADGNEITDHSNIKVYIFYNPHDFEEQTLKMYKDYESIYGKGTVALSDVTTEAAFNEDWGNMMSPQRGVLVHINHHGSNQAIHLDGRNNQYITSTGDGITNKSGSEGHLEVKNLASPNIDFESATLYINSCHSALGLNYGNYKMRGSYETIMSAFINHSDFKYIRGTVLGVSYSRITKHPRPHFPSNNFWYFYVR